MQIHSVRQSTIVLMAVWLLIVPDAGTRDFKSSGQPTHDRSTAPSSVPPQQEIVFKPEIISASPEHLERIETQLKLADTKVMDYMLQGMKAVEEGHRLGFQHFDVWYRSYSNRKKGASTELVKSIMGHLLSYGLKVIFPESTPFIEGLRAVTQSAYAVAAKNIQPTSPGDVDQFLSKLRLAEEEYLKSYLEAPNEFRKNHLDALEAAKWAYVEEWLSHDQAAGTGTDLPQSVIDILTAVGVPKPGSATATRVAEVVLTSHILDVYQNDREMVEAVWYGMDVMAEIAALREMDAQGNRPRICALERGTFTSFFWTVPRGGCPGDR
jgi:hypothetical protein